MEPIRRLLRAPLAVAALLLAACSGKGGVAAPGPLPVTQDTAQQVQRHGATAYVYGCTAFPKCFVFDGSGKLVRTVSTGFQMPGGLATDPQGNLYLADEFAEEIAVYAPGMTQRVQTLSTGSDAPLDVAVHDGWIATSDLHALSVFAPGSNVPARLTDHDVFQGGSVAFDSHGNCYWSLTLDRSGDPQRIDEFVGCGGAAVTITVPGRPGSLAFDGSDNLYYANDSLDANAGIYRCAGTANCTSAFAKGRDPLFLRFDARWKSIYTDDVRGHGISKIDIASGKIVETFVHGFTQYLNALGLAVGPGPG
jgi:hypothetical protein